MGQVNGSVDEFNLTHDDSSYFLLHLNYESHGLEICDRITAVTVMLPLSIISSLSSPSFIIFHTALK